jgi:hypothetical protein
MSLLHELLEAISARQVEVVDLTAPLRSDTPILQLPEPFANTIPFQLEEISRFDERGPAWCWNNIHTGEHTGTHFDAPNHWISGRDREDVSQVPTEALIAPAVVLDFSSEVAENPDFLLEIDDVRQWEKPTAHCPSGVGCSIAPGGTSAARSRPGSSTPMSMVCRTRLASHRNARDGWHRTAV